jgi:exopolysaccharide production protein ExoY
MEAVRPQMSEARAEVDVESVDRVLARAAPILRYRSAASTFYQRRGKRLLDITLGTVLSIGLLPTMAVAALAVLLLSGWPVFYRAKRLGTHGRPFHMLKLRTMVNGAHHILADLLEAKPVLAREYEERLKLPEDPRRTRIGAILRRFSIDELPQLWHVITGEMSLVGPRPYAVEEIALLSSYPEILDSAPGITGPWQVAGRNEIPPQVRIALDVKYVANITLAQDLRCLLATLKCLVRADGQ